MVSLLRFIVLPLKVNPAAAAQGALAIEARADCPELLNRLRHISSGADFAAVESERASLASYGGGCHQKIGVSILPRPYGTIFLLRGLTDGGIVLDRCEIDGSEAEKSWVSSADFFTGRRVEAVSPAVPEASAYFVAKADAVAASGLPSEAVVWTAGLETWRALTERGFWVYGSSEGLGERERPRIETLLGVTELQWLVLTHETSTEKSEGMGPRHATYRIHRLQRPFGEILALVKAAGSVRWKSAGDAREVFAAAARESAEGLRFLLTSVYHICGPGWTYEALIEIGHQHGHDLRGRIQVVL